MKNFIKNGQSVLLRQQTDILSAATVIAIAVFASRILGLIRDRLLTRFPVDQLDVYFAAFRIPDFIFQIMVMGALTTAFIPIITQLLSKDLKEPAWRTANTIINLSILGFSIFSLIIFIFSSQFSQIVAPGFTQTQIADMARLTRIMLLAQLFFILSNFFSAIVQSSKRFLSPAIAPVVYNLGIIFGIVFLSPVFGIDGPAWGVVIGTILHFLVQLPVIVHLKFRYEPKIDLGDPQAKEIGKLMLPRTLGMTIAQLSLTIDTMLASGISASAITVLNLATHLAQIPIGLFGSTIAQASLPTLAEEENTNNFESFKKTLISSLAQILFLTLPLTAILVVLRIPIVRLVFGSSTFPWEATVLTGKTLAFLGIGIIAQAVLQLIIRAFYALRDSGTPVKVGVFALGLNITGSILVITVLKLPIWGLAISSSIAEVINVIVLFLILDNRIHFSKRILIPALGKMFFSAIIAGICLYIPMKLLDQLVFDTTRVIPLISLTAVASFAGLSVYLFLTWLLDVPELEAFLKIWGKIRNYKWKTSEISPSLPTSTTASPP